MSISIFLTVHCQWSHWWKVGSCSKKCGKGIQNYRRKKIVKSANGGNDCKGKDSGKKYCNTQKCPISIRKDDPGCKVQCKKTR